MGWPRRSGRQLRAVAAPACGVAMVTALLAATGGTAVAGTTTVARPALPGAPVTQTVTRRFTFTGDVQTLDIPAGVGQLTVTALGAEGGGGHSGRNWFGGAGGAGTQLRADVPLDGAATTLQILVGGDGGNGALFEAGDGGWNGGGSGASAGAAGGGGGASEVRTSAGKTLLVAGGGGGGGAAGAEGPGGYGGPTPGTMNGGDGRSDKYDFFTCHGRGGGGGTTSAGGYGGNSPCAGDGIGGGRLVGGRGGISVFDEGGGGGGGGYFGGGGGGGAGGGSGGGGGAGSSYAEPVPHATVLSSGVRLAAPFVEVSYTKQLTCDPNPTLRIGEPFSAYLVLCTTTLTEQDGDITVDGPAPYGMIYEIGVEVRGGPLVLVLDDLSGRVQGPARDYHIVVHSIRKGGATTQADVNIMIRA